MVFRETTNLLYKKDETWIPMKYRPAECLKTTFKILAHQYSEISDDIQMELGLDVQNVQKPHSREARKLQLKASY